MKIKIKMILMMLKTYKAKYFLVKSNGAPLHLIKKMRYRFILKKI